MNAFFTKFLCFLLIWLGSATSYARQLSKAEKLIEQAETSYEAGNIEESLLDLKKATVYAQSAKDPNGSIPILNQIAVLYHRQQKFHQALAVSVRQYQLSKKAGDKVLMANALNNIGVQHRALGNLPESINHLIQGLKFADEAKDSTVRRKLYNNLASVFIDLKDKKRSLLYATKSYLLACELKDTLQIAKSLSNLAISEELSGAVIKAVEHLQLQAAICKKMGWKDILSDSYNNLAEILVKQKKYDSALELYKNALNLNQEEDKTDEVAYLYLGMANCYHNLHNYKSAQQYFDMAIQIAQRLMSRSDLKDAYLLGSEIEEAGGRTRLALVYRKNYEKLSDSLSSIETQKYVHDLELKYQTSVREKKLAQQELELSKKNKYIILALSVILLLAGGSAIAYLVNKSANQAMKLVLLQAQIHPHFLFNTLNNLYSLSLNKSEEAPQVVLGLAQILRYILYECNNGKISLENEFAVIEKYIFLERTRYKSRLEINFTVTGTKTGVEIEPLFLLPLVENAFKHGIGRMGDSEGWINIEASITKEQFTFKISNNRPLEQDNESRNNNYGNIGLKNIRRRLGILYPKKHKLKIISEPEHFIVILKLIL